MRASLNDPSGVSASWERGNDSPFKQKPLISTMTTFGHGMLDNLSRTQQLLGQLHLLKRPLSDFKLFSSSVSNLEEIRVFSLLFSHTLWQYKHVLRHFECALDNAGLSRSSPAL
ncbi:hypothetical protein AMTRI_Chr02g257090 [Amborella trichopoda]